MTGLGSPVGFKQKILIFILVCLSFSLLSNSLLAQEEGEEEARVIRQGPPPLEKPMYLDLGSYVVNMPGDKYYLKASIQVAFENQAPKAWMAARMVLVKDMLITHLQSISVPEFDDIKNRSVIKKNIQIRLNSLFPSKAPWEDFEPIRKILFLEFYKQ